MQKWYAAEDLKVVEGDNKYGVINMNNLKTFRQRAKSASGAVHYVDCTADQDKDKVRLIRYRKHMDKQWLQWMCTSPMESFAHQPLWLCVQMFRQSLIQIEKAEFGAVANCLNAKVGVGQQACAIYSCVVLLGTACPEHNLYKRLVAADSRSTAQAYLVEYAFTLCSV